MLARFFGGPLDGEYKERRARDNELLVPIYSTLSAALNESADPPDVITWDIVRYVRRRYNGPPDIVPLDYEYVGPSAFAVFFVNGPKASEDFATKAEAYEWMYGRRMRNRWLPDMEVRWVLPAKAAAEC